MRPTTPLLRLIGTALAATLLLAACAVQWENPKAAREIVQSQQPAGSAYLGWRVYQDRCARCHGVDAQGTPGVPNLLTRMPALGPRQFVSLVLYRYDSTLQGQRAAAPTAREAQVEVIMQRQDQPLAMPAWQDEARVNAHILDLHAYLSARADGRQGVGKPAP